MTGLLAKRRAAKVPPAPVKFRDGSSLGPVVENGEIRYLSVSQLEKFDPTVYGGCERRWWYRYVKREKEPQKSFAKVGDQCHAQAEHYLKTGDDVLGDIIRAGRRFLPRPGSDLLVEVKFGVLAWPGPVPAPVVSELVAGGVPLTGKADLMHCRGEWVDDDGTVRSEADPATAETLDHKTTKQIDNVVDDTGRITSQGYAKTAAELADTWQMLGYGELAWQRWPHIKFVRLGHAYYQTKGKRAASKRSIVLPIETVRTRWREGDALVERMKAVARTERAEDVPANYGACSAYGGCPHRQKCPRDIGRLLKDMFGSKADALVARVAEKEEEGSMSLLAKRKAAMASGTTPAAAPDIKSEIAALEAEERAIKAGITPPDMPAPLKIAEPHPEGSAYAAPIKIEAACGHVVGMNEYSKLTDGTVKHIGCSVAPAVVAAAKQLDMHPQTVADGVAEAGAGGPCPVGGTQIECDMDLVASKKFACACGTVKLKLKPAKLGDGKYYSLVPKHDVPGAPKVETTATPPATSPPAPPVAPTVVIKPDASIEVKSLPDGVLSAAEVNKIAETNYAAGVLAGQSGEARLKNVGSYALPAPTVDLYHDAIEDGIVFERLETYTEKLCAGLCETYHAADVRCAPKDSPLGFGGWKGAVAALAKSAPPKPGAYLVSSSSEIAMVVFEALAPLRLGRVVRPAK